MSITSSAKKALRQDARRRKQNEQAKQNVKRILKQTLDLAALPQLFKVLDKAAKTGVIKKNTAARKKSRIAKLLKSAAQTPAAKR